MKMENVKYLSFCFTAIVNYVELCEANYVELVTWSLIFQTVMSLSNDS